MSVVLSAAGDDVRHVRRELRSAPSSAKSASSSRLVAGETPKPRKPRAASERFAAAENDENNENSGARSNQLPAPPPPSALAKANASIASGSSSSTTPLDDEEKAALDADDSSSNNAPDDYRVDSAAHDDDDVDAEEEALVLALGLAVSASVAPPMSSRVAGRVSESAVPEKLDPEFVVAVRPQDFTTTRSSLVSFEPSAKNRDGGDSGFAALNGQLNRRGAAANFVDFSARDSCASDADAFAFQFLEDGESSRASNSLATPRALLRANPYDGISIDVTSHSINNQGVVLYHVDIKGPEGLLSTYTIRRRYRAFKELHQKLQALIAEYAANQSKDAAAGATDGAIPDAFSADNVPDSPHTQARNHQRLQQIAENSVLSASFAFPALPSGGVWSYLKRHDVRLVEQRKKRFEEILRIAIRHPATKNSAMLDSFLSVAPSLISQRGSSYVSLQDYSVPVFDRQRESIERKQLKLRLIEGRRQRTSSEASSSQS